MQLRLATDLTSEQYVTQSAWEDATLSACPLHPGGGCGFARHGTYTRISPPGTRIARWYCPEGHCTFSLLPDSLAARLSGTLAELEAVVDAVECASSQEAAADLLRLDIELPGALRWTRRRVKAVHRSLNLIKGLIPDPFAAWPATLVALRQGVGVDWVLPRLREVAEDLLPFLPPPLGFHPPLARGGESLMSVQQQVGPDPPLTLA